MFMNELEDLIRRSDRIVITCEGRLIDRFMRDDAAAWISSENHENYTNHKMTALIDFLLSDDDLEFNFFKIDWTAFNIEIIHTVKPYKSKACI